ncbi:MAG: hypothetical protein D4R88_06100 [Methanosarcinales archaeon]|nr:MAG: hypothetical protein D4R88_06100 [Methanosarcinales archaeon]
MVRVIINFRNEDIIRKVRDYGKVIYKSDLLNIIGVDVPENNMDKLRKINGIGKISFPGKADILSM